VGVRFRSELLTEFHTLKGPSRGASGTGTYRQALAVISEQRRPTKAAREWAGGGEDSTVRVRCADRDSQRGIGGARAMSLGLTERRVCFVIR